VFSEAGSQLGVFVRAMVTWVIGASGAVGSDGYAEMIRDISGLDIGCPLDPVSMAQVRAFDIRLFSVIPSGISL